MRRERKLVGIQEVQHVRPYGLGVDVAKAFHAVCLLIPKGQTVERLEFEVANTLGQLAAAKRRLLSEIAFLGPGPKVELSYALESTGTYHCPIMRVWAGRPCLVNPGLSTSFKARKTDRIDAFKLATQHLSGLWPESHVSDEKTELLRMYTRTRHRLIHHITRIHNSINMRLWQFACADLKLMAKNPLVRAAIEDLNAGRYQGNLPQFQNARLVPKELWQLLVQLYETVDSIRLRVHWIEQQVESICDKTLSKKLQTYPGVGPVTAAVWIAEMEPSSRFTTDNQAIGYAGLDPTPQISGGKTVGMRLRKGNKFLNLALMNAAGSILMSKSLLATRFAGLRGHFGKRRAMVARYLLR
jgi:transposase